MEKTIYELLNEVQVDFTEYEQIELSSEEKDRYKQKILMEVKTMKENEKKGKKRIWKKATAIAAACVLVIGAAGIAANPVLAKQIASTVFGKLINISREDKCMVSQEKVYEKIAEHAVDAEAEMEKLQDTDGYVTKIEEKDFTLSVSDVYSDGNSVFYTISLETENEDLKRADTVLLYEQRGQAGCPWIEMKDGMLPFGGATYSGLKKSEDGTFVGMNQVSFYGSSFHTESAKKELQSMIEKEGRVVVNWDIHGVTGIFLDQEDERGNFAETTFIKGEWNLRFPVPVDNSENQEIEINKEENGILVKSATKSKTALIVSVDYSTYATKPPYDFEIGDICIIVKDMEGNSLEWLSSSDNGLFTESIEVLYDGQKDLVVEVLGPSEDPTFEGRNYNVPIAEIPIQLQ